MLTDPSSDDRISRYLKDEFKTFNAQLPRKRKVLADLLKEAHPHVVGHDGSAHFFRRKELESLSKLLDQEEERSSLWLPILLEVSLDQGGITIRSSEGVEAKIFSQILRMPVVHKENLITIFRPQLSLVRKVLKTTTQYVFVP
jgi:uncharacterized protein (UPF0216 family)